MALKHLLDPQLRNELKARSKFKELVTVDQVFDLAAMNSSQINKSQRGNQISDSSIVELSASTLPHVNDDVSV